MIGTNLPPGTEIVCIDDNLRTSRKSNITYIGGLDGLIKGQIYTIKEYYIILSGPHKDEIVVCLNEITRPPKFKKDGTPAKHRCPGYDRVRFRRLHLPECLTSLLNTKELETMG